MKKYIFTLITFCMFQAPIHAETTPSMTSVNTLKTTNSEIEQLSQEIRTLRKQALNAEIEAQEFLLTEWDNYVQKIEEADRYRDQAILLEKRIKELRLKTSTSTPPNS